MKKVKIILASILVIFTLVFANHTVTQTSKVTTPQNFIYTSTELGPMYPDPIFAPRL
jgi:hypothetical protein